MILFLDLDATLNDLMYRWCAYYGITPKQCAYYGWMGHALGHAADGFWKTEELYMTCRPLPGARELIAAYPGAVIVTHTPAGQSEHMKERWVREHLGDVQVVHARHKAALTSGGILVDDHPGHIHEQIRFGGRGVLFNHNSQYGWSRPLIDDSTVVIRNYEELYEYLASQDVHQ